MKNDFVKNYILEADAESAICLIEFGAYLTRNDLESIMRRETRQEVIDAARSALGSGNHIEAESDEDDVEAEVVPIGTADLVENAKRNELKRSAYEADQKEHLLAVAGQINADFEVYKEHEKEATRYMLKIGLMLEYAKEQLPHGQLMKWAGDNLTISYPHASRFRKLAQAFIKANELQEGEAFALVDPQGSTPEVERRLQQMAFEFLGDKAQAELFAEYGIQVREPKKLGGARTPKDDRPATPAEMTELLRNNANEAIGILCEQIQRVCIGEKRSIVHAERPFLQVLEGDLIDALKNVRTLIKAN